MLQIKIMKRAARVHEYGTALVKSSTDWTRSMIVSFFKVILISASFYMQEINLISALLKLTGFVPRCSSFGFNSESHLPLPIPPVSLVFFYVPQIRAVSPWCQWRISQVPVLVDGILLILWLLSRSKRSSIPRRPPSMVGPFLDIFSFLVRSPLLNSMPSLEPSPLSSVLETVASQWVD